MSQNVVNLFEAVQIGKHERKWMGIVWVVQIQCLYVFCKVQSVRQSSKLIIIGEMMQLFL
ncbi:hypothetical protein D3C72_2244060 [compost metagenome]